MTQNNTHIAENKSLYIYGDALDWDKYGLGVNVSDMQESTVSSNASLHVSLDTSHTASNNESMHFQVVSIMIIMFI